MYKARDKYDYYEYIKNIFEKNGLEAGAYTEINFGLQFAVLINESRNIIRIYESKKKGVSCDFSQIKNEESLSLIKELMQSGETKVQYSDNSPRKPEYPEDGLIGTDESGKGDYFGPLVIAGVYADGDMKKRLEEIGAADSKTLSDTRIRKLADEISNICRYSVVTIGNKRYNEMYDKIGNLNRLLAWGHGRVIENLLEEVDCKEVLSDQFGSPELIKNALMDKGRKINLTQRHRAEENVVVAAASILARDEYVKAMEKLSEEFGMEFPKGGSSMVVEAARKFVSTHGEKNLAKVAKLHFVITEKI